MTVSKIIIFYVVLIVAVFAVTKAEVDCKNRPPHVDFKSCCELSNLITEEIKEKCGIQDEYHGPPGPPGDVPRGPPENDDFKGPPGHHHHHHHGPDPCTMECAFNETGILNDDELQEDTLQTYLNGLFDDPEKVEFLTEKFKQCDEKRKSFVENMPHKHHHHHGHFCSGPKHGKMLMGCVYIESFKECPDNAWSNTDECNEARDHFTQCHPHFGPGAKQEDEDVTAI